MANNVEITAGTGTSIATDDVAGVHYQLIKLVAGAEDDAARIGGDATNGLDVDVTRLPALVSNSGVDIGDVTINNSTGAAAVNIQDGGNSITVDGTIAISDGSTTIAVLTAGQDNLADSTNQLVSASLAYFFDGTAWDRGVSVSHGADGVSAGIQAIGNYFFNGSTWDRFRGDTTNGLDIDVTRLPVLVANSGVDIGDVTINNASGGSAVNIQDGGNSITVDNGGTFATQATLQAGTNAIGKLIPPDYDVTSHTAKTIKYYTNAGAVTDGIIWSPAAGKRFHVTSLFLNVSAAATVTIEDDLTAGDSALLKMELAANSGVAIPFGEMYPLTSGEDAADLLITTTAGNIYVTAIGYEI